MNHPESVTASNNPLIESLIANNVFGDKTELIETHISWILLSGQHAYKIKKPLNLGFLDFSDLEKRHFYCQEEIRLNSRFGSDRYLGIQEIRGSLTEPTLEAQGPVLEYAVCMRRFPQEAILGHCIAAGNVSVEQMWDLALVIFNFHQSQRERQNPVAADLARKFGSPQALITPMRQNFSFLKRIDTSERQLVDELEQWTITSFERMLPQFQERLVQGMIRECHGDLHLGNILLEEGKFALFDCIEFSERLRWIDTMSEIAFLVMDLINEGAAAHSNRFLNHYLELSGDYAGLQLLPFYLVYRALVRAKVRLLEIDSQHQDKNQAQEAMRSFSHYLQLAHQQTQPNTRFLAIMHGASGTGKTTIARRLADYTGAIQLRSDVERKRLFNLSPLENSRGIADTIYTKQASEKTFAQLEKYARQVLDAGYSVIVDAVFLHQARRSCFTRLAADLGIKFSILSCVADASAVADRLDRRAARGDDASEAGYQQYLDQLRAQDPLSAGERASTLEIDTTRDTVYREVEKFLRRR